jgi:fatty acid desaturase
LVKPAQKAARYVAGILLGLGITVGELPNSFLKCQLDISPGMTKEGPVGAAFFLFDQVDLTIAIWIFLFFLIRPSLLLVSWPLLLTLVFHVPISSMGYLGGMRKTMV